MWSTTREAGGVGYQLERGAPGVHRLPRSDTEHRVGSLLSRLHVSLGLTAYGSVQFRALPLSCLYKADHCRRISAENQWVFYQMPDQQVEVMYPSEQ